jgi:hypothetical protein
VSETGGTLVVDVVGESVDVGGGDGGCDDLAADEALELGRGTPGGDAAVVEHDDVVSQAVGFVEVLGGEHDGGAGRRQLGDDVPQAGPGGGVEPGGGFVQEQHRWRADQAGGQIDPAAGPAGQLTNPLAGEVAEVEPVDEFAGLAASARAEATEAADQLEVLPSGEKLVQPRVLTSDPDAAAHLVGGRDDVEPVDHHPTGCGANEGGEDADEGGLAGAVVAEHPERGAATGLQVDAVERPRRPVGDVEILDEDGGGGPAHAPQLPPPRHTLPSAAPSPQQTPAAVPVSWARSSARTV